MEEINENIKQLKNNLKRYVLIDNKVFDSELFDKLVKKNDELIRSEKNGNRKDTND